LSNQPIQDKNTLAQVLGKINALAQKNTASALLKDAAPVPQSAEILRSNALIPVLTEVYQGDILHGEQAFNDNESGYATDGLSAENLHALTSHKQDHEKIVNKIMAEMQPMIESALKEALTHELALVEVKLLTTLEKDLNTLLQLRLESILKA